MRPTMLIEQELAAAQAAQQDAALPLPIRRAAERLNTPVTRQHTAPFAIDPIADAKLIIAHLSNN